MKVEKVPALVWKLRGHEDAVRSVTFSRDSFLFASASNDGMVKLWDTRDRRCVQVLKGHEGFVLNATFQPDGQSILSGGWDKTLRLWTVYSGDCMKKVCQEDTRFYSVAFSPDGRQALLGKKHGVTLRDTPSGLRQREFEAIGIVYCVAFSPSAEYALATSLT